MKRVKLADLTTQDLIDRFAQIGRAQDRALLGGQISKFNRLFDQMVEISKELKGRPGDQRRALTQLYTFPNVQVQLKAAKHTLAVVPQEARRKIEEVAESQWFPQAGEAGICLALLDDGTFKPT